MQIGGDFGIILHHQGLPWTGPNSLESAIAGLLSVTGPMVWSGEYEIAECIEWGECFIWTDRESAQRAADALEAACDRITAFVVDPNELD